MQKNQINKNKCFKFKTKQKNRKNNKKIYKNRNRRLK